MTDLALPNRSHIFSPVLILLHLALYRIGLRTMVFVDDIVLLGRPPSTGKPTWAPYDFCGNTHVIMVGDKALDISYAARGVRQTHVWNSVTRTCTPLGHGPVVSAARHSPPAVQSAGSQTSPLPPDDSWKWGWSPSPSPGRQYYEWGSVFTPDLTMYLRLSVPLSKTRWERRRQGSNLRWYWEVLNDFQTSLQSPPQRRS